MKNELLIKKFDSLNKNNRDSLMKTQFKPPGGEKKPGMMEQKSGLGSRPIFWAPKGYKNQFCLILLQIPPITGRSIEEHLNVELNPLVGAETSPKG